MSRITIWTHHITGQMARTFQQGGRDMNHLKRNYHRTRLLKHQPMGNNREGPAIKKGGTTQGQVSFQIKEEVQDKTNSFYLEMFPLPV